MSVSPRTIFVPDGVMVKPALSLSKFLYWVATVLSIAFVAPWPAGLLAEVACTASPGWVTSMPPVTVVTEVDRDGDGEDPGFFGLEVEIGDVSIRQCN